MIPSKCLENILLPYIPLNACGGECFPYTEILEGHPHLRSIGAALNFLNLVYFEAGCVL